VLPFESGAGGEEVEILAEGLSERIRNHLSRLDGFTVVAGSSTIPVARSGADRGQIAARLDRILPWLERLAERPAGRADLFQILRSPEIDYVRSDPRFRALLQSAGAPESFGRAPGGPVRHANPA
jgi:hypothetical protein